MYNAGEVIELKKGAIFDMDGTLVDTEKYYTRAWVETADDFGLERYPDLGHLCMGGSPAANRWVIHKIFPTIDQNEYFDHTIARVKRWSEEELLLMSGVKEVLEHFKANGVKMAVASSSNLETIEKNLARVGIVDYFDALISGQQFDHSKPMPDIFLFAAGRINVNPRDCYVFEDSFNGVKAGNAAGCSTIMIVDQVEPTEEIRALAAGVYNSFDEFLRAGEA